MATVAAVDLAEPNGMSAPEPPPGPAGTCDPTSIAEPPRVEGPQGSGWTAGRRDPAESADPGAIRGRLVTCGGSLPGAHVSIEGHPQPAISELGGLFLLSHVPPGTFDVTVEAPGEPPATIAIRVAAGRIADLGDILLGDLTADPGHCGDCAMRCPEAASCVYGVCLCADGLVRCGNACVTLADLDHCRACSNRCEEWPNMIPQCGAKDCIFSCLEGTADCDGRRTTGCETRIDSDAKNCGDCGNVCAPGQRCINYTCQQVER